MSHQKPVLRDVSKVEEKPIEIRLSRKQVARLLNAIRSIGKLDYEREIDGALLVTSTAGVRIVENDVEIIFHPKDIVDLQMVLTSALSGDGMAEDEIGGIKVAKDSDDMMVFSDGNEAKVSTPTPKPEVKKLEVTKPTVKPEMAKPAVDTVKLRVANEEANEALRQRRVAEAKKRISKQEYKDAEKWAKETFPTMIQEKSGAMGVTREMVNGATPFSPEWFQAVVALHDAKCHITGEADARNVVAIGDPDNLSVIWTWLFGRAYGAPAREAAKPFIDEAKSLIGEALAQRRREQAEAKKAKSASTSPRPSFASDGGWTVPYSVSAGSDTPLFGKLGKKPSGKKRMTKEEYEQAKTKKATAKVEKAEKKSKGKGKDKPDGKNSRK